MARKSKLFKEKEPVVEPKKEPQANPDIIKTLPLEEGSVVPSNVKVG